VARAPRPAGRCALAHGGRRRCAVRAVRRDPGHRQVRGRHSDAHAVEPFHLLARAMVHRLRGRPHEGGRMSFSNNNEGRPTLVRSYRNLTVREIRARLEGPLGDAERVTAQAELLRRGADDDNGPDTTFITGFAPTGALDIGAVE